MMDNMELIQKARDMLSVLMDKWDDEYDRFTTMEELEWVMDDIAEVWRLLDDRC